ncbi:hypothetical protein FHU13_004604 [Methylobacterium sp. R2-1]|nr:hypothetical protein [Methylobacterium sp. R2-1]
MRRPSVAAAFAVIGGVTPVTALRSGVWDAPSSERNVPGA